MSDDVKERDLILSPNEFCFVSDATKGNVNVYVGPHKTSLANTDQPVIFDAGDKRFQNRPMKAAVQTFQIAPEGWYIVLKNPSIKESDDLEESQPKVGSINNLQDLTIGRKINIPGPISFPLWPGQMSFVLQGHHLRSNQYIVARVYDENSAKKNWKKAVITPQTDAELSTNDAKKRSTKDTAVLPDLTMGKLLVIKGTDVSFYIPPTGIEVVKNERKFVREAVTLERLEYCILIDEDGNKRFERGPAVVFPKPTEKFHVGTTTSGGSASKFKAIELNNQMGLYIKVITDYTEADGKTVRKAGDELFITGEDTKIYFPREEHAIIKYDKNEVYYAITIPAGEARYVLDKITGNIDLVTGPLMFLPDPRKQVIVRRVLDTKLVELMYPGNSDAINHNMRLLMNEAKGETLTSSAMLSSPAYENVENTQIKGFAGDRFKRNNEYTPPRTIQLNNKYDGAVRLGVWTGYAVQIVSTTGERRVVVGPATELLKYNETPEVLKLSRGTPKDDARIKRTVYLRFRNNTVSDIISAETKDRVQVSVKVTYRVNFEDEPNTWFDIENYVQFLVEHCRSMIRNAVKMVGIEAFDANPIGIVRDTILGTPGAKNTKRPGRKFDENNMRIYDLEVLNITIGDQQISNLLVTTQHEAVAQTLDIAQKERTLEITKRSEEIVQQIAKIRSQTAINAIDLEKERKHNELSLLLVNIQSNIQQEHSRLTADIEKQKYLDEISQSELGRREASALLDYESDKASLQLNITELESHRDAWVAKAQAIAPKLIEALHSFSDKESAARVAEALGPMTLLGGDSATGILNNILRGTSLEGVFGKKEKIVDIMPKK